MRFIATMMILVFLTTAVSVGQESGGDLPSVDLNRARALFAKQRRGEELTSAEESYLKRAQDERKRRKENSTDRRAMDPTAGDNLASPSEPHVAGVKISLSDSPLREYKLSSPDGVDLSFAYRVPKGNGPWPVVVFFHGGGEYAKLSTFQQDLVDKPIQTRFLNRGYVVVQCSRRPYWKNSKVRLPNGFYDAVGDSVLIVQKVKALPEVDPEQIVLFGGSGGGILAIVTACKTPVACVVAGEPASVIPLDPKSDERGGGRAYTPVMEDPLSFYTAERKKEIQAWMQQLSCPILMLQGKQTLLYRTNFDFLIPELKRLGNDVSVEQYRSMIHGFYWGKTKSGATEKSVEDLVETVHEFATRQFNKSVR